MKKTEKGRENFQGGRRRSASCLHERTAARPARVGWPAAGTPREVAGGTSAPAPDRVPCGEVERSWDRRVRRQAGTLRALGCPVTDGPRAMDQTPLRNLTVVEAPVNIRRKQGRFLRRQAKMLPATGRREPASLGVSAGLSARAPEQRRPWSRHLQPEEQAGELHSRRGSWCRSTASAQALLWQPWTAGRSAGRLLQPSANDRGERRRLAATTGAP
jgi:hypothetical protein